MEVIAKSKYVRISPKKVRLVAAAIRHLPLTEAEMILTKLSKSATRPLLLTLKQGKANAIKNFGLKEETFVIKRLEIVKGPSYKRIRPVSRGQWHPILKRTSHITMILEGEKGKENIKEHKEDKEDKEDKENKEKGGKKRGTKS